MHLNRQQQEEPQPQQVVTEILLRRELIPE
jgi:hypothetical protein